jgi:hypothetical protein
MSSINFPPLPKDNCPLEYRIRGDWKDSSFWEKMAIQAQSEDRMGDAYYYWLEASSMARNDNLIETYDENADECLDSWRSTKNNYVVPNER